MSDSAQPKSQFLKKVRSSFFQPTTVQSHSATSGLASLPIADLNKAKDTVAISTSQQLDVLEKVLQEVEQQQQAAVVQPVAPTPTQTLTQTLAQTTPQIPRASQTPPAPQIADPVSAAWPLAVSQATDTLNQPQTITTAKESQASTPVEKPTAEAGGQYQMVEVEPNPEIPVEVESYLQEVEDHQSQLPQEIVISGDSAQLMPPPKALRPVVVLPISSQTEDAGAKKNPKWSVRWLVEWSRRLMKMFSGKIVYADSETA